MKNKNEELHGNLEEMKIERLNRTKIATGKIINYYHDTVRIPNGNIATWDFIGHQGAAAVLPVTDAKTILLVRQYRNALDRFTLEIPAGGLENAMEPRIEAAARELEEETGYRSDNIVPLISIYPTVAYCNEKIDIFLARDLKKSVRALDEDEYINVEEWSVQDLEKMIYNEKMQDAKTIAALLAYKNKYLN